MLRPKEKRDYDYRQYAASVVNDPGCAGQNGKSDWAVNEHASIVEDDPLLSFDDVGFREARLNPLRKVGFSRYGLAPPYAEPSSGRLEPMIELS